MTNKSMSEQPSIAEQPTTPVIKRRLHRVGFFGFVTVILLGGILYGWLQSSSTDTPKTPPAAPPELPAAAGNVMGVPLSMTGTRKSLPVSSLMLSTQTHADKDKLTQLRQHAPLQMYATYKSPTSEKKSTPITKPTVIHMQRLAQPSNTVVQGTVIPAVLLTAINSELSGMVTARVTEHVYGRGGKRILIPRGTQLMGMYQQANNITQQRVFILWQRLLRSDNVSLQLNSASVDRLGQTGSAATWRTTHFWARFGQASLLSVIGYGAANLGEAAQQSETAGGNYRTALAERVQTTAGAAIPAQQNTQPILFVPQGTAVQVMVAHDLIFSDADDNV